MAKNAAFESDGDGNRHGSSASAPNAVTPSAVTTVNQRPVANENTSLSANLDTYFSDEKIVIPENIDVSRYRPFQWKTQKGDNFLKSKI